MTIAKQINSFIEQMPEQSQAVILELVKTMISSDDILTDEDIADIKQARDEYSRGEVVPHNAVNWN